jgi:two-component system LytT family sensor kinase
LKLPDSRVSLTKGGYKIMNFEGLMRNRYKIALSISLALTLFFVLPWMSLMGEEQYLQMILPRRRGGDRLIFLALSVFLTSMIFFQYNFFWKRWIMAFLTARKVRSPWLLGMLNLSLNLILLVGLAIAGTRLSSFFFDGKKTFFTFYLFRTFLMAVVAMLIAYVYEVMEQSKQDRIKLLMLNNEKIETELASLKNQIDPHFLFNSLSSLTGVIRQNQQEAIRFVSHLSETFRYVLDHRECSLISLYHELSFLESYLYMMKVRFGSALKIHIDIGEVHLAKRIPQFGLQLLVENAIKHNLVSERKPLTIHISADAVGIVVSNNLQLKKHSARGYGIGLANLRKQYELLGKPPIEVVKTDREFNVYLPLL